MEECLPQDMLEAILVKLDRETLCTARLVSRTFCAAASANIPSRTVWSPSQAVSLERFPRLGHVTVRHMGDNESLAELDPCIRPVMTQLTFSPGWGCARMTLPELLGMPKLRELSVDTHAKVDRAATLHRLSTLEALRIGFCSPSAAADVTATTWLTSLVIGPVIILPGEGEETAEFSWLQHATNLRNLQALQIYVSHEALPLIGNLTGLTGLTWLDGLEVRITAETYSIAPLSRLGRLRSLKILPEISESNLAIACSLGSGSLVGLSVRVDQHASADCGRLLAHQTALTRLAVGEERLCNSRHLVALRMELLQSLELLGLNRASAQGLDALQKATSLTHLCMVTRPTLPDVGLSQILGRLTHLRSLELHMTWGTMPNNKVLNFRVALSPLTALTKLLIRTRAHADVGDLRALLGLTGLRVLDLGGFRLTNDVVSELAVLTNLRSLRLKFSQNFSGITSLAPATDIINPLREARGWPPVHATCEWTPQLLTPIFW